jgi:hypothetical protein
VEFLLGSLGQEGMSSLEYSDGNGVLTTGVSAVLSTVGHTEGGLGVIARALNRKPVHLLLNPLYRLLAKNRVYFGRLIPGDIHER